MQLSGWNELPWKVMIRLQWGIDQSPPFSFKHQDALRSAARPPLFAEHPNATSLPNSRCVMLFATALSPTGINSDDPRFRSTVTPHLFARSVQGHDILRRNIRLYIMSGTQHPTTTLTQLFKPLPHFSIDVCH